MPQIFSQTFKFSQEFYKKSLQCRNKNVCSTISRSSEIIVESREILTETKETLKHDTPEEKWIRELKQSKTLQKADNFKGSWMYKIDEKYSRKSLFYLNDTETIEIDFMIKKALSIYDKAQIKAWELNVKKIEKSDKSESTQALAQIYKLKTYKALLSYFRSVQHGTFSDLEASAIELPLKKAGATLIIILPDSTTGLPALESKLNQSNLTWLSERMRRKVVNVMIPKFSRVVRKALREVNEEEIEADSTAKLPLCDPLCLRFHADRPFLFALIKDSKVLFVGKKIQ